jgi:Rrf2 family protein
MKLSTRTRYGTRIVIDLALHPGKQKLEDIAERQQVSRAYLTHLITPLIDAGVVTTSRGHSGGIELSREPREIKIGGLARLLEGENSMAIVECLESAAICQRSERCMTRKVWKGLGDVIFAYLDSVSIQDVLDGGECKISSGNKADEETGEALNVLE